MCNVTSGENFPEQRTYLYYKAKKGKKMSILGPFPDDGMSIEPGTKLAEKVVRLSYRDLKRAAVEIKEMKK